LGRTQRRTFRQFAAWPKRRRDETGAELIEFAFVSVILVALVYGIVFFGVTLGAKVTISQAAADGSRAGIVSQTATTADSLAANQAATDVGWLGAPTPVCGATGAPAPVAYACVSLKSGASVTCSSSAMSSCTTACTATVLCPVTADATTAVLMVVASEATCPSNSSNTCLTTYVTYYDQNRALIPTAPGLALLSPTNVASSSTQEVSAKTP